MSRSAQLSQGGCSRYVVGTTAGVMRPEKETNFHLMCALYTTLGKAPIIRIVVVVELMSHTENRKQRKFLRIAYELFAHKASVKRTGKVCGALFERDNCCFYCSGGLWIETNVEK